MSLFGKRVGGAVGVAAVSAAFTFAGIPGDAEAAGCPALMVYGIQGTGQSSEHASPDQDNGFLSLVLGPLADGKTPVERKYVPYDAGFGGAVPGGSKPYDESVMGAVNTGKRWVNEFTQRCPDARVAFVGYSQGAHAARLLATEVIEGKTKISTDDIAAVATFGDPTRPKGAPLFPGAPGQVTPSPVPGTAGEAVSKVAAAAVPVAEGGGIGPSKDVDADLSELAGRYMSFCTPGDLSCDAPSDAPIVRLVTNMAGQSTLNKDDPVATLTSLGEALALTTVKTAVPLINEDVQAPENNLESLSYQPQQTLSSRLADASDPRSPMPTIDEGLRALWKVGTIGLNAVRTMVRTVATPETIGQVVMAGATNPAAIIGVLAPKVAQAAVELVPPATTQRWVSEAFSTFQSEFEDNEELFSVTSALKLFNTAAKHGSYGTVAATPTGAPPTKFVTEWLRAAAQDLAKPNGSGSTSSSTPEATTSSPSSGSSSGSSTPSVTQFEDLFPSSREVDPSSPTSGAPSTTSPERVVIPGLTTGSVPTT